jgi:tRNA threonylcarbamoyladenosine biosynthesis protein TsaE
MSPTVLPLADEAATLALGRALASEARGGRVVYLHGDLGAGKTTLTRGLLRALGWTAAVKSPTYTLVELYELSSLNLYHFDLYRFNHPSEWLTAGLADLLDERSLAVIEWPERASAFLPKPDLEIRLEISGSGRLATIEAHGSSGERWLRSLSRSLPS